MNRVTLREPSLADVIALGIKAKLSSVWTALPGVIESYDKAKQKADIRVALKDRVELGDGEEVADFPVLPNVPIVHPSGGGFFCAFPLKAGDPVLLVFSARPTDTWKSEGPTTSSGESVDPLSLRSHHISDAFAIPGGRPFCAPLAEASDTDLVIGKDGGDALVTMKDDGSILIGKNAAKEAARKGDAVRVTIPIGTFLVAAQAGVMNSVPVDVDGTIQAGSSKVKVGD